MNGTALIDLYTPIRYELIRQDNSETLPDSILELAIEHVMLMRFKLGFLVKTVNRQKQIEPELTAEERKLLILKTAYSLLETEDAFSYRTSTLSKSIKGRSGLDIQRTNLLQRIKEIEGGAIVTSSENEFWWYCHN
jgi:hypothetical protein